MQKRTRQTRRNGARTRRGPLFFFFLYFFFLFLRRRKRPVKRAPVDDICRPLIDHHHWPYGASKKKSSVEKKRKRKKMKMMRKKIERIPMKRTEDWRRLYERSPKMKSFFFHFSRFIYYRVFFYWDRKKLLEFKHFKRTRKLCSTSR